MVNSLVGPAHVDGPSRRTSRPGSVLSASQLSAGENRGESGAGGGDGGRPLSQSIAIQTEETTELLSPQPFPVPLPPPPQPKKREIVTYSKSVQTEQPLDDDDDDSDESTTTIAKKQFEKEKKEQEEIIRVKLRKEIEDELQASSQRSSDGITAVAERYPLRTLSEDELKAVTSSDDFFDFVERSTKVIERALDEDYDVLVDYELGGLDGDLNDDDERGKKKRSIKEVSQLWDERWSNKRMITDLSFSPKVVYLPHRPNVSID